MVGLNARREAAQHSTAEQNSQVVLWGFSDCAHTVAHTVAACLLCCAVQLASVVQVDELNLDNSQCGRSLSGLFSDKYSGLKKLSLNIISLNSLHGFPKLPALERVTTQPLWHHQQHTHTPDCFSRGAAGGGAAGGGTCLFCADSLCFFRAPPPSLLPRPLSCSWSSQTTGSAVGLRSSRGVRTSSTLTSAATRFATWKPSSHW